MTVRRRRILAWVSGLALLAGLSLQLGNLLRILELYREPPPLSLPMPVQGVGPEQIADSWGGVRSEGRAHEGTDIFALRGTPVISTTHGVVVRKGWNRLGGRRVLVLGPAGWSHYYAHLDEWSTIGLGDWVEVGTVLGYVGDSGDAQGTPTHLHYGIYIRGEATNPFPLLTHDLPARLRAKSPPPARGPSGSPRRRPGARRRSAAASR
jgi:murein DD-endopeptidase MepM/ murein hydrolase activator NlpD